MKKVRLKPTATFEPRPRPNQMMNSGASAMRGIAFSAVKIGFNTASVDGLVTNSMPTSTPATLPSTKAIMVPPIDQ